MKKILQNIFILASFTSFSQTKELEIFDVSQKQVRLLNSCKNLDLKTRNKIFADSIYQPYKLFWEGYMGGEEKIVTWMNNALNYLPEINKRNETINGKDLSNNLIDVRLNLLKLTGYEAKGKWYIVYGAGWSDLGGIGDYAMFIDLAHESNTSNEKILKMIPHELTHQIMTNVNITKDNSAINIIIGEGFAVYMNQLYWKEKYSLNENLGYSKEELSSCLNNNSIILKFFNENKFSSDSSIINIFRNRSKKIDSSLPGAIGYYIGYKIIESYVKKYGKNSWKDIFTKSPKTIYELSDFNL